jgi:hypothetical protein
MENPMEAPYHIAIAVSADAIDPCISRMWELLMPRITITTLAVPPPPVVWLNMGTIMLSESDADFIREHKDDIVRSLRHGVEGVTVIRNISLVEEWTPKETSDDL